MADRPLTEAQEVFCVEYAKHANATAAYRTAYPKSKAADPSINVQASRLLAEAKIKLRISELKAVAEAATDMTIARWAQEVTRLATYDPRKLMHEDGRIKMPHELDEETAAAIASFEVDLDGGIKYKFWPKAQPLDMMAKHKGAYERDNKQKTEPLAALLQSLPGAVFGVQKVLSDGNEAGLEE